MLDGFGDVSTRCKSGVGNAKPMVSHLNRLGSIGITVVEPELYIPRRMDSRACGCARLDARSIRCMTAMEIRT